MLGTAAVLGGLSLAGIGLGRIGNADNHAPLRRVRLIAPGAAGGGFDEVARSCEKALPATRLIHAAQITNLPGAGGTIGLVRFVEQFRRHREAMLIAGSTLLSSILVNRTPIDLSATTPLARLAGTGNVLVVPATSPYRTLPDLIAAFRRNPGAISWAGGSIGGGDHVTAGMFAKAIGVDPRQLNYVAYAGGGEILAALLGGHVVMASSTSAEFAEYIRSGQLRCLGVTSAAGEPGVAAPTLRSQSVDMVFHTWRGIMAASDIAPETHSNLVQLIEAMTRSRAWKAEMQRQGWTNLYLPGDGFVRFLDDERRAMRATLSDLGLM